jgi:hypothetical protein
MMKNFELDSQKHYTEFSVVLFGVVLGSDANNSNTPITGVKSNEEKKYPQNPIFRLTPKKPINKEIPM